MTISQLLHLVSHLIKWLKTRLAKRRRPRSRSHQDAFSDQIAYLSMGVQYYIAARHALYCKSIYVAPQLAHLAVEMFLKMALIRHYTREEVRSYEHKVPKLWREFQSLHKIKAPPKLNSFIELLHRWQLIRYPDFPARKSLGLTVGLGKSEKAHGKNLDRYALGLDDLDELMQYLIPKVTTAGAFRSELTGPHSKETYERGNNFLVT